MDNSLNRRILPINGAHNVRDIGGYRTKDNKHVKWNTFIRAGDLAQLTEEDLIYLSDISLKTIVDFRSKFEKDANPNRKPVGLKEEIWLPIDAGNLISMQPEKEEDIPFIMMEVYKSIICNSQQEFKAFFQLIENKENIPLLYHCSAGKDRTGIATALLLSALGVDKKTIMEDYLLSAEYIKGKYDAIISRFPVLAALFSVQAEYLEAAFQEINEQAEGIENYLRNNLGANIERLRELYLE